MINLSILILSYEVNGPGGLFDIDATLPLVAIQFVLLVVLLQVILYNPLLKVIEERKEYILRNLAKASKILAETNQLTNQYQQKLDNARTEAQLEIAISQKFYKKMLDVELNISQKYIDTLLGNITKDLLSNKETTLKSLDKIVQSLCAIIEVRLSI